MEQLVLGFFQEQLSKVIVGFRKEQVNANLLNGKGEITDVSLNCAVINEAVRKVSPLLEFEEIHVDRLGFHVTAWANLRKAPIVVDIGVITAVVQEPLHCLPRGERKRLQVLTEKELVQLILQGLYKPLRGNGSYGFVDRIVDNLTIEIEALRFTYQAWGKFKTRRVGPWTPPTVHWEVEHLKVVSVDQYGHESSPDQVWAHNRLGMQEFFMYKKITGDVHVKLVDVVSQKSVQLIRRLKFETQAAIKRRLRDGAVLGLQLDLTIPSIEIEIESKDIPILAHWVAATQYCLAKDRPFEDPLVQETPKKPSEMSSQNLSSEEKEEDDSEEEEVEGGEGEGEDDSVDETPADTASVGSEDVGDENDTNDIVQTPQLSTSGSMNAPFKQRPLILLPNGLVIYENVCFTCSIHDIAIRGVYAKGRNGFVQMASKGCITELMWPKTNNEHGLYLQTSVSFMSIQERLDRRIRTILIGGIAHGDHMSIHKPSKKPQEVNADENFPLFERRVIRDDPLDLRHTFPSQAFGAKTTIDFPSKTEDDEPPMVLHEVGIDEFDIVLDADACCRALCFFLNEDGGGFDARWHSGDWTDLLTPDMLKDPNGELQLDDHVQNAKQILLDENFMISSDRFNVTARFSNIEIRIPAAVTENVRSCDILVQVEENTLVISSALPRTFLSGKIGNSISGDALKDKGTIDFPNDPSDIAYSLEKSEDPSLRLSGVKLSRNVSTFRAQLTARGFQIKTIPIIPFCNAVETQQLIAPMEMTMIVCFEGEPPSPESNFIKIALFISMHVHKFSLNVDFDLLAGATSSILHHHDVLQESIATISGLFPSSPHTHGAENDATYDTSSSGKVKRSLKGRRVMVRRHLERSRETGGLGVVFCLQVAQCGIALWRQNVPFKSPLRHTDNGDIGSESWQDEHNTGLLKLVDTQLKEFELGVEFDFQAQESRRTIVKCCLEEGRVLVCNVGKAMGYKDSDSLLTALDLSNGANADAPSRTSQWNMVELVTFGMEKLPGKLNASYAGENQHLAIRLEEQLKNGDRSWSLSADLNCPTTVNACIEEVKDTIILLIEALLLPTWSKREFPSIEGAPFPNKTIGAMLYSVCSINTGPRNSVEIKWDQLPSGEQQSSDPIVERALRVLFKLFLPADMQLVLLRVEIANLLLSIPNSVSDKGRGSLGLHLMQTDLVVRFYPKPGVNSSGMEDILACKGVAWSSLISTKEEGYYQRIRSRQSLLSISLNGGAIEIEELVHPFNIGLTYAAAKVHLAMDEDMKVNDIRRIESFFQGMKELQDRSIRYHAELASFLAAVKQPISGTEETPPNDAAAPAPLTPDVDEVPQLHRGTKTNILRTQLMLRRAHAELGKYEKEIRLALQQKKDELECLQRKVFEKEKDRFAALALLSSRVAGWIRTGGVHRTGQRVARKSTLWPYWAVLRKNLLILYTSPGEPKPSDVILLEGAKIRQLAGGRSKQDVKRGFAIIERGGMTRYFIASSSQEFSRWIQEISEVIGLCRGSLNGSGDEEGNISDRGLDDEATKNDLRTLENDPADLSGHPSEYDGASLDDEGENLGRPRRLGNRFVGAKNRLGAALENARQKGKELSDRRRDTINNTSETNAQFSSNDDPAKENDIGSYGDSTAVSASSFQAENAASLDIAQTEGSESTTNGTRRRLQFGKALTDMKLVTKNKLGTAIQSARQKGAEASVRRSNVSAEIPPRPLAGVRGKLRGYSPGPQAMPGVITGNRSASSSFDGDAGRDSGPSSFWTCKACTFINTVQTGQASCEMCGEKEDIVSGERTEINPSEVAESFAMNGTNSQADDSRRGRFGAKIGAAVRSVRQNSMEDTTEDNQEARGRGMGMSSRFNFMKRRPGTSTESLFDDSAMTLKHVHASGLTPSVGAPTTPKIPLKVLQGNWVVSVKPHKSPARQPMKTSLSTNSLPATEGKDDSKTDAALGTSAQSDTRDPSEGETGHVPNLTYEQPTILEFNGLFDVRTQRRDSSESAAVVQTACSFGELMQLHASVSECVAHILPQLSSEHFAKKDPVGGPYPLGDPFDLVENVLITGRTLGGFFDDDIPLQNLEKTREYQAEIIEWFLNSLLRCPLPIETLMEVSDVLGICASTKDAVTAEASESAEPLVGQDGTIDRDTDKDAVKHVKFNPIKSESENLSTELPQEIFSLLSACGTELLRAETAETLETRARVISTDPTPTVAPPALSIEIAPMNIKVFEPLLPPSVSDRMQEAMHEALINVMAERDEAHAQLIASNVSHVHELEQERRKNERLRIEHDLKEERRKLQQPNVGNFFQNLNDDRSRRTLEAKLDDFERALGRNTDQELADTSRQLAEEVSAKTSHALELVRLKEAREIERQNEAAEKQALKDELRRVKALLAQQNAKTTEPAKILVS